MKNLVGIGGREGKTECSLCGDECENVSHVLWECSAYSSTSVCFIKNLQELLEDEYEDFESLVKVEKSSYVLGSELWESKFDGLLSLVKENIIDVCEKRKNKLYVIGSEKTRKIKKKIFFSRRAKVTSVLSTLVCFRRIARSVA